MRSSGAALALVAILAGCAQAPQRDALPPEPAAAPRRAAAPGPLIAQDDRYVVVVAQPGDTLATLAQRWRGDASARDAIARFNGVAEARPGEAVAIPLKGADPKGVTMAGAQAVTILCYHRFGPKSSSLTVTPQAFEAQMAYLARNGYSVVPLTRLAAFLEGREALPPKAVVITIDDGYRSTWEVAWPVLRKHGFPATVFLYTDFAGAPDALTWAQMREMIAGGLVEIQPHSKTHTNLAIRQPDETDARYRERVRREVEGPVEAIRAQLGSRSTAYAFPYGDVNDAVAGELRARGVALGATVTPGGNAFFAPPYMLRRTMVFGGDDLDAFRAKLVTTLPVGKP
ncbi:MAG: polysaccharide deacetylase family protein [Betaproteobacteria bacterium]|nr:polysaccharide deacetylase family protein [Betaproteobacteria bacterium]MDH5287052.1 polysaccharide deacetylase family protein [Betaproteobacteria bacterium]